MANPNIVNVSNIVGNNASFDVTTTDDPFATAVVSNPAASGKIYKINSLYIANSDGLASADFSVWLYAEDDLGGSSTPIAYEITIPAGATILVVDKTSSLYLLEDQSIGITAGTANALTVTASWEEIS